MDIGTNRAAEILGITPKTVQEWCRAGKLKTATQDGKGRPWHISEQEVCRIAEERSKRRKK